MQYKIGIIALIGVIAAGSSVGLYALHNAKNKPTASSQSQPSPQSDQPAESDNKFATLKGDAFDEAFIADMLAHHEGAVNMAEQAQAVTAHEELRSLAGEIVRSQSLEMMDMRNWQKEWGYEITNSGGHMSHGGGGAEMAGDMTEMMAKLSGLTGDAYDKEFLAQMTIHHEQAVDMARYAETNAKHNQIKVLARDIIAAQETEIQQMQQWQKEWGYQAS